VNVPELLPERTRNELLRRVDWRFLVRCEREPRALVAGCDRSVANALALVCEEATAGERPDLAVLVDPEAEAIAAAAARLAPGGNLYAEWRRPQLGGRDRLRRRIEAAGLEDVHWYWPWPPVRHAAAFWLPLDAPEALGYFLAPRRRSTDIRRRLLAAGWPWARRLRLLAPLCAVARKPGGGGDALEDEVQRHSGDTEISWILLSGGRRTVNKVVGLPVADSEGRPRLVVKFARTRAEEEPLRREAEVLGLLARSRPDLAGIPRPLFLERRCGRLALGETALGGEPLIWSLDRSTFDRLCTVVTDWLVALARGGERQPARTWKARLVDGPLDLFAQTYGSVVSPTEIEHAQAALASLDELPVVCEQRDCAPWNILVAEGHVAVADWESAEPAGLPGLDLVYFLANASFLVSGVLDRGPVLPTYAASLDPTTHLGQTVTRCAAEYCERVGVEPHLLPSLRLLCWTIHAHSEYRRFALDVAGEPPPELLARSLFVELWRAEVAGWQG
jgi:hypothetical protein